MQEVIIGLLALQITILPLGIIREGKSRWRCFVHIMREDYDQHIEADTVHGLIANVTQGITLKGVYSCNVHVTETSDIQKELKTMSQKD